MSFKPITLWQPNANRHTHLQSFIDRVENLLEKPFPLTPFHHTAYGAVYDWSVSDLGGFWSEVWDFCDIIGHKGTAAYRPGKTMRDARFFPEARLNYAENLLRQRGPAPAIISYAENQKPQILSYDALWNAVEKIASSLAQSGVQPGDRLAGYVANTAETAIAALAAASLGAVWCSCSPDFGVTGALDRFAQIEPKILFATTTYSYNGKIFDNTSKISEIAQKLPSVQTIVLLPPHHATASPSLSPAIDRAITWKDFVAQAPSQPLRFRAMGFSDPLFILFTSGTTGAPKCIVHCVGGVLIQHLKEHQLHCDIQPGDKVFYFSTCGWMMWNWLLSALASRATIVLYDGAPTYPRSDFLFELAEQEKLHFLGLSARYLDLLRKEQANPSALYRLENLRMIGSTGSPLLPEDFDYVYERVKRDVCLASLSGGTDIVSCFALGCPILPVHRGELQTPGLGMKIDVFDDQGHSIHDSKGELVCTAPFPSMPIAFWNDPEGKKYSSAYFERFSAIWCHGDWVTRNSKTGGLVIYGRSDTVLKPGGVRIGTAEIYHALEQADDIQDAIAVGQDWDNDMRVILFVKLVEGKTLDDTRILELKTMIRTKASPRHVPAKIIAVPDIPRTRSGKIVEAAVRDLINNRAVKNIEALANPESLDFFIDIPCLQSA